MYVSGSVIIAAIGTFLTSITLGIIDAKALESRVYKLETSTATLQKDVSDFKAVVKEDIGHIKGQNDMIIKILKQEKR